MEMNNSDKMLKQFFSENKEEIQDNGFSKKIMRRLPEQASHSWIVWIFGYTGMAISLFLAYNSGLLQHTLQSLLQLPIYYLLGAVFSFPLVSYLGVYLTHKKVFV